MQLEDQIIAAGGTYPIIEYPRKKTKMALIPKRHRVYGDWRLCLLVFRDLVWQAPYRSSELSSEI